MACTVQAIYQRYEWALVTYWRTFLMVVRATIFPSQDQRQLPRPPRKREENAKRECVRPLYKGRGVTHRSINPSQKRRVEGGFPYPEPERLR